MDSLFSTAPIVIPSALVIVSAAVIVGILLWKLRPDLQAEARYRELQRQIDAQAQELQQARAAAAMAGQRADDAANLNKTMHQEGENLHEKVHVLIASEVKAAHEKAAALEALAQSEQRLRDLTARFEAEQAAHAALHYAYQALEKDDAHWRAEYQAVSNRLQEQQEQTDANDEVPTALDSDTLVGSIQEVRRTVQAMAEEFTPAAGQESEEQSSHFGDILGQIQKHLREYEAVLEGLRRDTREAYGGLRQEIQVLQWAEQRLHHQAVAFGDTVGDSENAVGSVAKLQLHQLVEFVGMQEYCEFTAQADADTTEGRRTPDMIVHLPEGQQVTVDAKADMGACREAARAETEEERARLLAQHLDNVKDRIEELASQSYRDSRDSRVEVTVLFLPGENLYATALENDLEIVQFALERNIVLCGPNSLMMMLKVVNQIWQRAAVTQEAERVRRIGINVYRHACRFVTKYARLGESIHKVTADYDTALSVLDRRLLPASRRLSGAEEAGDEALPPSPPQALPEEQPAHS